MPRDLQAELKEMMSESFAGGETLPTQAPSAPLSEDDWAELEQQMLGATNQSTGEPLPKVLDGVEPATAKVTGLEGAVADRLVIKNLASSKGTAAEDYLRRKYEDVQKDDEGNFKVKKAGTWYDLDPPSDPWETTKKFAKLAGGGGVGLLMQGVVNLASGKDFINPDDQEALMDLYGDNLDTMVMITAGLATGGATAAASGGATAAASTAGQIAAQGAAAGSTELIRTSLGRAVGTYEDDIEQQAKDIGIETLLGLGGQAVGVGTTWAGNAANKTLSKAIRNTKHFSNTTQQVMKGAFKGIIGEDALDLALAQGDDVAKVIDDLGRKFPKSTTDQMNSVVRDNIADLKKVALKGNKLIGKAYQEGQARIARSIPKDLQFDIRQTALPSIHKGFSEGLLEISAKAKRRFGRNLDDIANAIAEGRISPKAAFKMRTKDAAAKYVAQHFNKTSQFAKTSDNYKMASEFYNNLFNSLEGAAKGAKGGRRGFESLTRFKKNITDLTFSAKAAADSNMDNQLGRVFADMADKTKANFLRSLPPNVSNGIRELDQFYSEAQNTLSPLLDAAKKSRAAGGAGDNAFETLLRKIGSEEGNNVIAKDAMMRLPEFIRSQGDEAGAKAIESVMKQMEIRSAAAQFLPLVKGQGSIALRAGTSIMLTGGKSQTGIAFLGTAAQSSPRAAFAAIRGGQAVGRAGQSTMDAVSKTKAAQFFNKVGLHVANGLRLATSRIPDMATREAFARELFRGGFELHKARDPEGAQALTHDEQMQQLFDSLGTE